MFTETHRDQITERDSLYYMKNKDFIDEKRLAKHECAICGRTCTLKHKCAHEKSNQHQKAVGDATTSTNVASQS